LVFVEGAAFNATNNVFRRAGILNTQIQNFTTDLDYMVLSSYFPINTTLYSQRTWQQERGAFWLKSIRKDSQDANLVPVKHHLVNNTFNFIFCEQGGVLT